MLWLGDRKGIWTVEVFTSCSKKLFGDAAEPGVTVEKKVGYKQNLQILVE